MRLDFHSERVLAVVAHPDDAELLCAGTLARARDDGAAIGICALCQGDKGQPAVPIDNLADVRRQEMQAASTLLGAELFTGQVPDGTLVDDVATRGVLIEIYRQFRPTLVLAHFADDYHPDHQAASHLAEAASWFTASQGHQTPSSPQPSAPAVWWMDTIQSVGFEPGFTIDVSPYVGLKDAMLACHASQLQRSGDRDFAPLLELLHRQQEFRGQQCGVTAAEAFRQHQCFKRARAW